MDLVHIWHDCEGHEVFLLLILLTFQLTLGQGHYHFTVKVAMSDEKLFDQLHYLNILMDLFAVLHGYIGPLAVK